MKGFFWKRTFLGACDDVEECEKRDWKVESREQKGSRSVCEFYRTEERIRGTTCFIGRRSIHKRNLFDKGLDEKRIQDLMRLLDMQKNEAIVRTFKDVAKHFEEIFAELVNGGTGKLIMRKRYEGDPISNPDSENDAGHDLLYQFSGVKVKVRTERFFFAEQSFLGQFR